MGHVTACTARIYGTSLLLLFLLLMCAGNFHKEKEKLKQGSEEKGRKRELPSTERWLYAKHLIAFFHQDHFPNNRWGSLDSEK